MNKKRVNDIFYSLQGEGHNTGRAAIFIRFSGCNLKCPFCDTDFSRYDELTDDDIIERIKDFPSRFVVLTGGEPSLQAHPVPTGIDWTTCSPKGVTNIKSCDELKVIFEETTVTPDDHGIQSRYRYLQPCDVGDAERNARIIQRCLDYILQHPEWRLSLQTHKLAGFK